MTTRNRVASFLTLLVLPAFAAIPAQAQQWPTRSVRIIVPFPPGQAADIIARIVAAGLSSALGQQVVVDNRPGAGGAIGAELSAKAPPDGYTLGMAGNATMSISPALYSKLPYAPLRDFDPITKMADVPFVFCVHPSFAAKGIADLVVLGKRRPGEITYGSSGNGSTNHLVQALFGSRAGIELTHVPYKGAVASLSDLMSGRIVLVAETTPTALPHLRSGRLRGIGASSLQRIPFLPDLPTLDEQGIKGYDVIAWAGLVAPAGTPAAVLDRLNTEIVRIVHSPEVKQRFQDMVILPVGNTRAEFMAFLKAELVQWATAVKVSGAKVE